MLRVVKKETFLEFYPLILILTLTILFAGAMHDRVFADPGECGLDFLNIPVGAHSASTGQANYAGIEGAQAIFRNPALLGNNLYAFASYQYLIMDTRSQAAAVNLPFGRSSSFALGVNIFSPGEIAGYDDGGRKTGNLQTGDYLVRLGYSSQSRLNFGVSASYYEQRLDDIVGRGYGFGFGMYRDLGQNRLGFSLENLGPRIKIGRSSFSLPTKAAISGWFPIYSRFINLSADIIYSLETGMGLAGGVEYSPAEGFFLRAGGNDDVPISMGLGLIAGNFELDYSYTPSSNFGDRHLFSIAISR